MKCIGVVKFELQCWRLLSKGTSKFKPTWNITSECVTPCMVFGTSTCTSPRANPKQRDLQAATKPHTMLVVASPKQGHKKCNKSKKTL